jgi:hypothetical protein
VNRLPLPSLCEATGLIVSVKNATLDRRCTKRRFNCLPWLRSGMSDDTDDAQTRDESTGQYGQEYADTEFLARLWDADELQTKEVAEAVGCSERTAHERLTALENDGRVSKRSVSHVLLWSLSDDERESHGENE